MTPPPLLPQTENSDGLPFVQIAAWSGAGLILLLGGLLLLVNLKSGNGPGGLIREAQKQMDNAASSADLVAAKRLAEEALLVSGEKHRKEAQELLDEVAARQEFVDRRLKEVVSQGEEALQYGNVAKAQKMATRGEKIRLASNQHLLQGLFSKIAGYQDGQPTDEPRRPPDRPERRPTENSWPDIVEMVKPSVVVIASKHGEDWGTGTGFFVADDIVITNQHVIAAGDSDRIASEIYIKQHSGEITPVRGTLYQHKAKDIAVLKVENISASHPPLNLVDRTVRQGEVVAAMGHPRQLEFTFTIGYVSAIREGETLGMEGTWVHHSAPISSGNSGGPLLNQQGDVVAMNTWVLVDSEEFGDVQNLNFAISAEDISQMIRSSKYDRGVPFGRDYSDVTENIESLLKDLLDQ